MGPALHAIVGRADKGSMASNDDTPLPRSAPLTRFAEAPAPLAHPRCTAPLVILSSVGPVQARCEHLPTDLPTALRSWAEGVARIPDTSDLHTALSLAQSWTAIPIASGVDVIANDTWNEHREVDAVRRTASAVDPTNMPELQATVYMPDGSSLSYHLSVHETGRGLNTGRNFGRHVRSLRRARGMTQEVLAERSGLSADTIRRLEHGSFSPSLDTLRKLCSGLDLMLSTLFESYELGDRNEARELMDLLATRRPSELVLATKILRTLFEELDTVIGAVIGTGVGTGVGPGIGPGIGAGIGAGSRTDAPEDDPDGS